MRPRAEAVVVLEPADARLAALRRDDDGAIGRVDAVQARGSGPFSTTMRSMSSGLMSRGAVRKVDVRDC
jgi:hypothetical protein